MIMNIHNTLNIIFPSKCSKCGKIGESICKDCEKEIKKYEINLIEQENIKTYKNRKIKVEKFYIYKYDGIIRTMLINYKFNDKSFEAETFAKIMSKNKKICRFLKNYDIIIPVPLSKQRKLERGYNQTELIVKKLGNKIKIETKSLIKTKNIKPQSQKRIKQRISDVKGVYNLQNIDKIKGKKLLVFDDIYTTGSTTEECIKELSKVTNNVGILVIAKDYMEVENGRFS